MVKQALPDQFYNLMFLAGFLLMLTGRAWHLMFLFASKSSYWRNDAQWKRYCFALVGFVPSLVMVIVLLTQYSLDGVVTGLNEMYDVSPLLGVVMWATFVIHVVTIPGMLAFIVWFYFHPVKRLQRVA